MVVSIAVNMKMTAISTYETSEYFSETTLRYISESYHLHTRRRENLKSHSSVNIVTTSVKKKYKS
jgi:hypothetical protein